MGLKNSPKPLVEILVVFLCRCSNHYTIHLSTILTIQNSTIQKLQQKTAPSYFSLYPLQSVVPIITLSPYIILVNTKHQSSKKPSWSSKPHKASILGLFVIPFLYFMYFNFSIFLFSTILPIPLIYCKLFNHQLSTLYILTTQLFQSLHYTPFHYTNDPFSHYIILLYYYTLFYYFNHSFPHYTSYQ